MQSIRAVIVSLMFEQGQGLSGELPVLEYSQTVKEDSRHTLHP